MKFFIKIEPWNNTVNLSASIIIHILIFIIAGIVFKFSIDKSVAANSYVQVKTGQFISKQKSENKNQVLQKDIKFENFPKSNQNSVSTMSKNTFLSNTDTTGLQQIYKEPTLDVSIRYPVGWTYVDQDVSNKLDGVTFWSTNNVYSPPPYVHLEVKEKYLFNPNRYKYSIKTDNYIAYYNSPEELSGQVSQEVYIRTEIDKDFSIKLIMEGKESFITFQPVFFGMIKTFKFDNSLF
jgi:hypothetical protein